MLFISKDMDLKLQQTRVCIEIVVVFYFFLLSMSRWNLYKGAGIMSYNIKVVNISLNI